MHDPCDPTPNHAHGVIHHHPAGQAIGRIRRHGTHRIARRLHAMAGACPAGPPLILGSALFKAVAPAFAFVALTAVASDMSEPSEATGAGGAGGLVAPAFAPAAAGAAGHVQGGHPPFVMLSEPPSLSVLLLAALGWAGLRCRRARNRAQG